MLLTNANTNYFYYYYSRTSDEATDRPLQTRYDQKVAKYGQVAEQSNLRFVPAVFSHTGQIHGEFKSFVKEQIKQKLVAFEGDAFSGLSTLQD